MTSPVPTPTNLPRSIDVQISISQAQTEIATDMTLGCIVTKAAGFPADQRRVQYFSSWASFQLIASTGSPLWWAGKAFFDRTDRPNTLAIGQVFTDPTQATITGVAVPVAPLQAITDGSFTLTVAGNPVAPQGLDFSSAQTINDVAQIIGTNASLVGLVTTSIVNGAIVLTYVIAGEESLVVTAGSVGTDVSALLGLTAVQGAISVNGYTPGTIADEMQLVANASINNGRKIFGWCLDGSFRDTPDQKLAADWCSPQVYEAAFFGTTNLPTALNTADTTNNGYLLWNEANIASSMMYHNNPQYFPDVSYMAKALSVDYSLPDSTITLKFKDMPGIPTVPVSETDLSALNQRRINTFTAIGNNARTIREGVQSADGWFTDTYINLANLLEEMQVEVLNAFLRNKKIPYNNNGQNILISAVSLILNRYVSNGTLSDREIQDPSSENGLGLVPAFVIDPAPIAATTASMRAARIAPPIQVTVNEAGAMHSIAINIEVVN